MGKKKRSNLSLGSTCCGLCLSQVQPAVDAEPVGEKPLYWTFSCRGLAISESWYPRCPETIPSWILGGDCIAHRGTAVQRLQEEVALSQVFSQCDQSWWQRWPYQEKTLVKWAGRAPTRTWQARVSWEPQSLCYEAALGQEVSRWTGKWRLLETRNETPWASEDK